MLWKNFAICYSVFVSLTWCFWSNGYLFLPLPLPLGNFSELHKHISVNVNLYNSVKNILSISKKCGRWHYIRSRRLVIIVWCLNLCIVPSILVLQQCFVWMQVVETCSLNRKLQFVNFQSHMLCMYSSSPLHPPPPPTPSPCPVHISQQAFISSIELLKTCSLNSKLQFVNFQSHILCMYSSSSCINCTQAFISSIVGAFSCTAGLYCVVS